ncbi:MAG: SWIM zinc finger family protein [Cytophagales bacterium]|nr:SWIM zinc finger family protein [Cytophagales bacterium]
MSYWGYKPYVSVSERQAKALKAVNKAKKKGVNYSPIEPYRGAVAKTFWGKAWCSNLEQYSDYENRLPRGRAYARNGSVIDLKINAGTVQALVMGSSLYQVSVHIKALPQARWKAACADCASSVASLIELLQGKLSKAVMERICTPTTGLFPEPSEMAFDCSCPDWAGMCKHVAAVLYGVGARLDQQPELLFTLRHVEAKDLVAQASAAKPKAAVGTKSKKVMADADLADVFGLDIAAPIAEPPVRKIKTTATKAAVKLVAKKTAVDKGAKKPSLKIPKVTTAKKTVKVTQVKTLYANEKKRP